MKLQQFLHAITWLNISTVNYTYITEAELFKSCFMSQICPLINFVRKGKSQISKNNVKLHDYKGLFFKKICLTIIILLSNNQTLTSPVNGLEIEHRALSRLPFTKNFGTFAFYKKKHKHIHSKQQNKPTMLMLKRIYQILCDPKL